MLSDLQGLSQTANSKDLYQATCPLWRTSPPCTLLPNFSSSCVATPLVFPRSLGLPSLLTSKFVEAEISRHFLTDTAVFVGSTLNGNRLDVCATVPQLPSSLVSTNWFVEFVACFTAFPLTCLFPIHQYCRKASGAHFLFLVQPYLPSLSTDPLLCLCYVVIFVIRMSFLAPPAVVALEIGRPCARQISETAACLIVLLPLHMAPKVRFVLMALGW